MAKGEKLTYQERLVVKKRTRVDVWQDRVARLLVILLLCVQPLYFNADRYFGLTGHKFVFFCICMGVVLLFTIIIWCVRLIKKPRLRPEFKFSVADWAILAFAAITLISATFSPFRNVTNVWVGVTERYDGAITQLLYIVVFFIVSRWYKPRKRDTLIFAISAILVALIGIFQFYGMDFFGLWPKGWWDYRITNYYSIYFRSTLGNINIVSTYVCIATLLCGFMFIRNPAPSGKPAGKAIENIQQPLWLAASALCFWLMELANSDSGLVGIVAGVFLALPFFIQNRKTLGRALILVSSWAAVFALQRLFYQVIALGDSSPVTLIPYIAVFIVLAAAGVFLSNTGSELEPDATPKWKLGVIIIAACIVAGIAAVEILGARLSVGSFAGRLMTEAREALHGRFDDDMGSGRIFIWKHALAAFPNYPIIGTGPDTFFNALPAEAHQVYGVNFDKAHNEYLQILICQGILGIIAYLTFLGHTLVKAIPRAFKDPLIMAILAAFVGYCVQAFFNISLPIASQSLFIFAGVLASRQTREAI